ncbi:MAG TPA: hypothetical protein VH518_12055 [Tepidisphaeraceae bacterium]|jgi:hypothetical protein
MKDSVTLVLNGKVFIEDFAAAVDGWKRLMAAISQEESPRSPIHWEVEELSTGSFFGTLRAEVNGTPVDAIERSVGKYEVVARSIRSKQIAGHSKPISDAAIDIVSVVGPRVTSVRFETDDTEVEIYEPVGFELEQPTAIEPIDPILSFGTVRGKLQTVSDRRGLRFMLYEVNTDRAVTCYIDPEGNVDMETLRNDWGKLATVVGIVRRDPKTGHATTVRKVRDIHVIDPLPKGAWRRVRGIAPATTSETPEQAIRRVRDG